MTLRELVDKGITLIAQGYGDHPVTMLVEPDPTVDELGPDEYCWAECRDLNPTASSGGCVLLEQGAPYYDYL